MSFAYKDNPLFPNDEVHQPCLDFNPQNNDHNYFFTPGQGVALRDFIENPLPITETTGIYSTTIADALTDVASLYKPFIITGGSGPTTTTTAYSKNYKPNDENTGVNVWNCGPFKMHFQTGFDCEYSNLPTGTITQTPSDYFITEVNNYIGVRIPILSSDIFLTLAPVCFSSFEPYTSGDVKSVTTMGDMYYTEEQLDKIKAVDPALYELLQANKYHIITKRTDSGFVNQIVIHKN
jgi:hypothetical protein